MKPLIIITETKIDKDYLEAFNLGYELAKELNLRLPIFKELSSGISRMNTMKVGMVQYDYEIKNKGIFEFLDSGNL